MKSNLLYMQQLNLFKDLPKNKLVELNNLMKDKDYDKNTEILDYKDINKVYILKKGRVLFYNLTPNGKKTVINALEPGCFFGNVVEDMENEYFAQTSEESTVCTVDKIEFFKFASNCPTFAIKLVTAMFDKLSDAEYKISILSSDTALEKFKKLLRFLARKEGIKENGKTKINRIFTHEELADMIGVSRQTTTEIINDLERKGIISRNNKYIFINSKI